VDLILTDPSGTQVDEIYPGAKIVEDLGLELITVSRPKRGQWSMAVYGQDVVESGEPYYAAVSTRKIVTTTTGGGLGIALIILLVAGSAIGSASLLTRRRLTPSRAASQKTDTARKTSTVQLTILNGPRAGQSFPLIDGMLIGRGSTCQLQLPDRIVSRQHARLRYSGSHWYIQDMDSQSGIEVNGARVKASVLNKGDRIRIGTTELEFILG
jgi:hypothetical protein